MTGRIVDKLTVIGLDPNTPVVDKQYYWLCKCSCGNICSKRGSYLRSKNKHKSCGCHVGDDLTGRRFGKLIAIKRDVRHNQRTYWICKCDCGEIVSANRERLISGDKKSCGSLEKGCRSYKTHGQSHMPQYHVWLAMIRRCDNPNDQDYPNYGDRGIKVCKRWHSDNTDGFNNFMKDIGYRLKPGDSLEREDNDLGYLLDNCDVIPANLQARNRRVNVIKNIEEAEFIRDIYFNRSMSVENIAEFFRCSEDAIRNIINGKTWIKI